MATREAGPQAGSGTLFIVATPIGNLGDITLRAIEVLKGSDVILAEDTRTSRVLLDHHGIRTRVLSTHAHNEASMVPRVLERLAAGRDVALITDAGTPVVSDPGGRLVAEARKAGFRVSPIPGASAITAAISAAGLDASRFTFFGFLPRSGAARTEALQSLSGLAHTGVLYEAPGRVAATLADMARAGMEDRSCVVGREISKKHEEFRDGSVSELAGHYGQNPPRGEVVILVEGASPRVVDPSVVEARVKELRATGMSPKDVAARLVAELQVSRNDAYRWALGR